MKKLNDNYRNILVVRTDRIGDVVLTTPSLKALREKFPEAHISILVAPITRELVEGNPYINEIFVDDRYKEHKGFLGFLHLGFYLRSKKFDLAIIYHTKKRTNLLCFLAGIKHRLGYKNHKFGSLLTYPLEDSRPLGKKHEAQYCLDVLKSLGIEEQEMELFLPEKEESQIWVEQFFRQNHFLDSDRIVAIHAGASDPSKRWPVEYFAQLIDSLSDMFHCKIISIGSSEVRSITREISSLSKINFDDLSGMITLSQLTSLLKKCDLLISNDSGPVHIAAAVQTPVISIFTRNLPGINAERWYPLSEKSAILSVGPENIEKFQNKNDMDFKKAGKVDLEYLKILKPSQVLESVDAIFKV